jgi:choline dehydrogenase-like flavoprotein
MVEDRQSRHQARQQRRPAGIIGVNLVEPLFHESPIHCPPQRHQRMFHVDDLIEPRAKKILLSRPAPLRDRISSPRLDLARAQLSPFILDSKQDIPVFGHHHHMGTTRMSDSPRHVSSIGTVAKNLYVAGSSVFPKGGGKNPTFAIGFARFASR